MCIRDRFETPLQKPHPPVWIPGLGSPQTLVWAAERGYPYIYLETDPQGTQDMIDIYTEAARESGYEAGPENFGYLCRIHVQDTDEKAYESAKGFLTGNVGVGRVPMPKDYMLPVGYSGSKSDPRIAKYQGRIRKDQFLGLGLETATYDEILASNRWIVGSPETVLRKLRETLSVIRPGILGVWTNDGDTSHADTMNCLKLMGEEVLPALREIGAELELTDPFQKEATTA